MERKKIGSPPGLRPHVWITGPDPIQREKYYAWLKTRSQAAYRKETWALSFEEFVELWGDQWARRGKQVTGLMMMKRDWQGAWTRANVQVVDRKTFHQTQVVIKQQRKAQSEQQRSKV
jgi:hypothetical protein